MARKFDPVINMMGFGLSTRILNHMLTMSIPTSDIVDRSGPFHEPGHQGHSRHRAHDERESDRIALRGHHPSLL